MSDAIQSVRVLAIDEEKLKYRVIVSFDASVLATNKGSYTFQLDPPTSFANSDHYRTCSIKIDSMIAQCPGAIADPSWTIETGGGALIKHSANMIKLDIPTPQTYFSLNNNANVDKIGDNRIGGFRQLIPLVAKIVGDSAGNAVGASSREVAWFGESTGEEGIKCANPFGKKLTITNFDAYFEDKCYLVSVLGAGGGAGGNDIGNYCYSMTITMIPNNIAE